MVKKLLIGIVALVLLFFIGGMFFYGFKSPGQMQTQHKEGQQSNLQLLLPFKKEDLLTKYQGIWPFGIRGGDHPNGHPGIDFETKVRAPVLAAADGKVTQAGEAEGFNEQKIVVNFDNGQTKMDIWYVGPMEVGVKVGEIVKAGDIIAHTKASTQAGQGDVGFLHFETSRYMPFPPGAICPAEFMNTQAKKDLGELFTQSKYKEREKFPLLCNECPPGFYPFGGCR